MELARVLRVVRILSARQAMYPLRVRVAVIACIGGDASGPPRCPEASRGSDAEHAQAERSGPSFAHAAAMLLDREAADDSRVAASQSSPRDGAEGVASLPGRLRRFFVATKGLDGFAVAPRGV